MHACGVATRQTSERYVPHMMDVACVVPCVACMALRRSYVSPMVWMLGVIVCVCVAQAFEVLARRNHLHAEWDVGCGSCVGVQQLQHVDMHDRAQRLVSLTRLVLFLRALMLRQPLGAPRRATQP